MSSIDKRELFDIVRQARALVKDVNASASASTLAQYQAAFIRMEERGLTPEKIAGTARSFYYYRAAWVHHYASAIRKALKLANATARAGETARWAAKIGALRIQIAALERYRPDPHGKNLSAGIKGKWSDEADKRRSSGEKIHAHSKRTRLRGLPQNWRETMFSRFKGSRHCDSVAIMAISGARPAELERGVKVTISRNGNLNLEIHGAKTHKGKYGQPLRVLEVAPRSTEAKHLVERVKQCRGELVVRGDAGAISDRVRDVSRKVFPRLAKPISAYVYRHQFSADLKACGMDDVQVSAALGHCVDETKRYYGAAQSARGDGHVVSVEGSRRVREKTPEKILRLERGRSYGHER